MTERTARHLLLAAGAALLAFAPAAAATAGDRAAAPAAVDSLAAEADALDTGAFLWEPGRATGGDIEIVVSLPLQRAFVYRGGTLIGVSSVSTGREGHETPAGSFTILQKREKHFSNLYNNAPMPFMQRLTWDGIALHAGEIPGRPASHGCIRLPLAFARKLFEATRVGASVHVIEQAPAAVEALAMVRNGGAYTAMGGPEDETGSGN